MELVGLYPIIWSHTLGYTSRQFASCPQKPLDDISRCLENFAYDANSLIFRSVEVNRSGWLYRVNFLWIRRQIVEIFYKTLSGHSAILADDISTHKKEAGMARHCHP